MASYLLSPRGEVGLPRIALCNSVGNSSEGVLGQCPNSIGRPAMTTITATTARVRKRVGAGRRQWIGLLYVAPAVALVMLFFVIPLGMTAWMSLHNWPLMGEHSFIGLGNYWAILRDSRFWNALRFTGYYTL